MIAEKTTFSFAGFTFEGVLQDGIHWFQVAQIVPQLGFKSSRALILHLRRHKEELPLDGVVQMIVETGGGPQKSTFVSLETLIRILLHSRGEAKTRVINWLMDIAFGRESLTGGKPTKRRKIADIAPETILVLLELEKIADRGSRIAVAIREFLAGTRVVDGGELLAMHRAKIEALSNDYNRSKKGLNQAYRVAAKDGFSKAVLKMKEPQQPLLPLGAAALLDAGASQPMEG